MAEPCWIEFGKFMLLTFYWFVCFFLSTFWCLAMSRGSLRCHHGLGHREIECLALPSRQPNLDGRIRRAQPTFVFEIRRLGTVLMRDRHDSTLMMDGFGAIRVVRTGDRIPFLGIRHRDVIFAWLCRPFKPVYRSNGTIDVFHVKTRTPWMPNYLRQRWAKFQSHSMCSPVCSGHFVREFVIRIGADDNEIEFLAIRNGRAFSRNAASWLKSTDDS